MQPSHQLAHVTTASSLAHDCSSSVIYVYLSGESYVLGVPRALAPTASYYMLLALLYTVTRSASPLVRPSPPAPRSSRSVCLSRSLRLPPLDMLHLFSTPPHTVHQTTTVFALSLARSLHAFALSLPRSLHAPQSTAPPLDLSRPNSAWGGTVAMLFT